MKRKKQQEKTEQNKKQKTEQNKKQRRKTNHGVQKDLKGFSEKEEEFEGFLRKRRRMRM